MPTRLIFRSSNVAMPAARPLRPLGSSVAFFVTLPSLAMAM